MKIAILAGGTGTRLWPWSREHKPKQLQSIIGTTSLIQQTYARLRRCVSANDIVVVAHERYASELKKQLPKIPKANFIFEPARRESANAIGLAAMRVYREDPKEVLLTVAADQWIGDEAVYARILKTAAKTARTNPDYSVLMGIDPTYPETGYGYIVADKLFVQDKQYPVFTVKQFIEKPNVAKAKN